MYGFGNKALPYILKGTVERFEKERATTTENKPKNLFKVMHMALNPYF